MKIAMFSGSKKDEMDLLAREESIFFVKNAFQKLLKKTLNLSRISAPLLIDQNSGIQDNLNGIEKAVNFRIKAIDKKNFEIIQSLAKWKRYALAKYKVPIGSGIYTDMNALRPDEETLSSDIHSVYVDQWDWEKAIDQNQRNLKTLYSTVKKIYKVLKKVESMVFDKYKIQPVLPENIKFIHTEELYQKYPHLSAKEREHRICRKYQAVFLIGIGGDLSDGQPHDGRAPDYDDWTTKTDKGFQGLNGDILVWNPVLKNSLELSSMGIRVDREAIKNQLKIKNCMDRLNLSWHKKLLDGKFPESMGGGIGQSRLCMFFLRKRHIGEVQASVWPKKVKEKCNQEGITLL